MSVNLSAPQAGDIHAVSGVTLGTTAANLRKPGRRDLTVIQCVPGSLAAGVFTQNRFCAAPVQVCREHLAGTGAVRALVINTGFANAGTGERGLADAQATCKALADQLGTAPETVLPFSTGVIMEPLPLERLIAGLPAAVTAGKPDGWIDAAQAIMTTDTVPKAASVQVVLGGETVTVTGIAKGAGMIHPNMATMLSFIATDARLALPELRTLVKRAADASFNRITVDGDTSTNDSLVLVATRQRGAEITDLASADGTALAAAVEQVALKLAQSIVRDGEGASKFITVTVEGGRNEEECRRVAYAIAHSPLVKTAFFASDPNLGRILAAVGYAGIADLDQTRIELHLDDVHVVTQGGRHPQYREEDGQRVMKQPEITVRVGLGRGNATTTLWTCDLTHDYVSINADYRS